MLEYLEKIRSLDSDEIIISSRFNFDKILIWPLIRWEISNIIKNKDLKHEKAHNPQKYNKLFLFLKKNYRLFRAYNKYFLYIEKRKYEILFFDSLYRHKIMKDGKIFEKETDYFIDLNKNTYVLYNAISGQYYKNRYIKNSDYLNFIYRKGTFFTTLKSSIQKKYKSYEIIEYLFEKNIINSEEKIKFNKKLFNLEIRLPAIKKNYIQLLDKINPKIIFVRAAYYGTRAYFIKWAKEKNIKVGEFQHGGLSKTFTQYNYSKNILNNSEYINYTPDYFLTFGDYWKNQVRLPSKIFTIGYPHLYQNIKKYSNIIEENNSILIISQGIITKKFVDLTKRLSVFFSDYKIYFKLHPGEVYSQERYEDLYEIKNVKIIKFEDIYEYILKSKIVIGYSSTALLEAYSFNKQIFYYLDSHSRNKTPEIIGKKFETFDELISLLKNIDNKYNHENNLNFNSNYFFDCNWENNYKNFLKKELDINI